MTARMLTKTIHFSSYSGGHIRSMRGFAVEVVLARHCNSTCPRLHDRQNASENNTFSILFWRSHSLHTRFAVHSLPIWADNSLAQVRPARVYKRVGIFRA
jgi:hypothetical protein